MTSRNVPGLGLTAFWDLYETSWKTGMDENLWRLSLLVQASVDSVVSALPDTPTQGDIHLLLNGTGTLNNIIAYDQGLWVYVDPFDGLKIFDKNTNRTLRYTNATVGWEITDSPEFIKAVYEAAADTNAFTDADRTKLDGIEDSADVNMTAAELKASYESNLNTNAYTDEDKQKLNNLAGSRFLGTYVSLVALRAAHPSPAEGAFGYVDMGVGTDINCYIWDASDNAYVPHR